MTIEVEYANGLKVKQVGSPIKMSDEPKPRTEPSPDYGAHTEAWLKRVGYTEAEIEKLREKRVI